ncbi:Ig-like domain-containing protein [Burkholderia multivorans]|uniref:Ig-like domain-containing protein n=1 Tax=Burkholderia multivorans TaxID=87883 RepID=UPI001C23097E|nr:Ig-like domain-containing protein [Burkholderia multivorans]MBU9491767.1 hypothetical protein [Burkholderia multivorans]
MDSAPRLEMHYYLQNESHAMDAMIRNRCEAEFLATVSHITQVLGVELRFEATVPTEGGFRDIWRVLCVNSGHPLAIALLTLILNQAIEIWKAPSKPNPVLEKQQIEINELTINHWKLENRRSELELHKLERDSQGASPPAPPPALNGTAVTGAPTFSPPATSTQTLSATGISNANGIARSTEKSFQLQLDTKVITRRSNFYKYLLTYRHVTAVGFRALSVEEPNPDELVITRSQFNAFIVQTSELPPDVSEALIEITSPVISGRDAKWKGLRNGEAISFAMNDKAFKQQVFHNEVSFQHGDSIRCILEADRRLNEIGMPTVTGYRVTTVLDKIDGKGNAYEMPQGRKKRFSDRHRDNNQADLFGTDVQDETN